MNAIKEARTQEACGSATETSAAAAPFVAISQFTVANGMEEQVKAAFIDRPHLVDDAAGFLGMQVISPQDTPSELWLITSWVDEKSFRDWHASHAYKDSHAGIPHGLKLVPQSVRIRYFDEVAR